MWAPTLLYATFAKPSSKWSRSPFTGSATNTGLVWWAVPLMLTQLVPRQTSLRSTNDSQRVVQEGLNLNLIDGQHSQAAGASLCNTGYHFQAVGSVCMNLIICQLWIDIKNFVTPNLSKPCITSSAPVCPSSALIDSMIAQFNYAEAFDLECRVKLVDARINDIADDSLSSKYLSTQIWETYVGYIRLAKLYINECSSPFLVMVWARSGKGKTWTYCTSTGRSWVVLSPTKWSSR